MSGIIAGLGSATMHIVGSLMSQKLFESVMVKVIIAGVRKLAKMSKTSLDDEIAEDIVKRLEEVANR